MEIPDRLRSRKLWVTIVTGVVMFINDAIGLGLDENTINGLALAVSAYLLGQSAVDFGLSRERGQKYEAWVNNATRSRDEA